MTASAPTRFYAGVTDKNWFDFLRERKPEEVNFWKPSGQGFGALKPGDLFLFKLHAPNNAIVGGGFFVRFHRLRVSLAWDVFGETNGCADLTDLLHRLRKYRKTDERDPEIGCIILTSPFFFDEPDWIDVSDFWAPNIVQGKGFPIDDRIGGRIWKQVHDRLSRVQSHAVAEEELSWLPQDTRDRFGATQMIKPRLGQGGFRLLVTDAYKRRCSISGEKTFPVLEAAHVRPYSQEGPHTPSNGLLLRSDLHILFDRGYLTVTPDLHIEVSGRIREEFENGRDYYQYHGKLLHHAPKPRHERPDPRFLSWHNEYAYLG